LSYALGEEDTVVVMAFDTDVAEVAVLVVLALIVVTFGTVEDTSRVTFFLETRSIQDLCFSVDFCRSLDQRLRNTRVGYETHDEAIKPHGFNCIATVDKPRRTISLQTSETIIES
jgi:hypothetical protein